MLSLICNFKEELMLIVLSVQLNGYLSIRGAKVWEGGWGSQPRTPPFILR